VGQLEHEVGREAVEVPLDGPDQRLGFDSVQGGDVGVEDDPLAADEENDGLDPLDGDERFTVHGASRVGILRSQSVTSSEPRRARKLCPYRDGKGAANVISE
jgi:hypothetical protein